MRKIRGSAFISLDGVIQGPGGATEDPTGGFDQGGWMFQMNDDGMEEAMGAVFAGEYDLLLGRRTYDIFAAYWPFVEGPGAEMGEAFTQSNKYVLTRGDNSLDWANSHPLSGIEQVEAVKRGNGPDLLIQGSSGIYPGLLAAGLIDRLTLFTFPVVLGKGKRLFGEGTLPGALRMVDHVVTAKGTVIATYEPAGPIPTGAWTPEPSSSAAEQERQRKMRDGSW